MGVRALCVLLRPFFRCRVTGAENVKRRPAVFVCNHLEIYGPIAACLHLPFSFRPWIIAGMLDRGEIVDQLNKGGVDKVFHWLPGGIRVRIPRLIAPFLVSLLRALRPIPVYRGAVRDSVKTLRLTVDAMTEGDGILIFPENSEAEGEPGAYKEKGVSRFFTGFAAIGREYYKRTGHCAAFHPVYVDKAKRSITIGPAVVFDPENGKGEEKMRIVNALYAWMEKK